MTTHINSLTFIWLVMCQMMLISYQQDSDDDNNYAEYLILGAGIAGLTAAKALTDAGQTNFLVLEGSSTIGGRVRSVQMGEWTVELGAQWFNSYTSDIGRLASRAGVQSLTSDYDFYVFRNERGQDVTDQADNRYDSFTPAYDYARNLAFELEESYSEKPDVPMRAALSLGGWMSRDAIDQAIEYYELDFVYGHQPETTSTRHSGLPSFGNASSYTEDVVVDQSGGLFKLVKLLHDDVFSINDSRLRTGQIVNRISYSDDMVTVLTTDGRTYSGKYCIVTFSLGVLQNDAVTFEPELPEWKRYAIKSATFVTDFPIYIRFPADTQPFWDGTEYILHPDSRRGFYTLWQNFDSLIANSRILQVQVSGPEAKRIARLTTVEVRAEMMNVLRAMYPGEPIPEPEDVLVADWETNRLHFGCYMDWAPHFLTSEHDALRAPVGRLYFAGEAYDRDNFGYMEGAYRSAIEQTSRLLDCARDTSTCEEYVPPYEALGCTYKAAENYDSEAQLDNGSCQFERTAISGQAKRCSSALIVTLLLLWSMLP